VSWEMMPHRWAVGPPHLKRNMLPSACSGIHLPSQTVPHQQQLDIFCNLQLGFNPVAVVSTHLHTNNTQNKTMKHNTTHT